MFIINFPDVLEIRDRVFDIPTLPQSICCVSVPNLRSISVTWKEPYVRSNGCRKLPGCSLHVFDRRVASQRQQRWDKGPWATSRYGQTVRSERSDATMEDELEVTCGDN